MKHLGSGESKWDPSLRWGDGSFWKRNFNKNRRHASAGWHPICFLLFFVFFLFPLTTFAQTAPAFPKQRIVIERAEGGVLSLDVEIAQTPEQKAYGLMFRESLPKGAGMLFLFDPPQDAAFWMKNTKIPLDIIFIRADGHIARIKENAVPFDETPVLSGERVESVLELGGGQAAAHKIRVGDRVLIGP